MTNAETLINTQAQEKALDLAARMRNGEKVPLSEIVAFLEMSQKRVNANIRASAKTKVVTDVDFF